MKAKVGNLLVISSPHIGQPARRGVITQVNGLDGESPYVVRWLASGEVSTVVPDPGATIVKAADLLLPSSIQKSHPELKRQLVNAVTNVERPGRRPADRNAPEGGNDTGRRQSGHLARHPDLEQQLRQALADAKDAEKNSTGDGALRKYFKGLHDHLKNVA